MTSQFTASARAEARTRRDPGGKPCRGWHSRSDAHDKGFVSGAWWAAESTWLPTELVRRIKAEALREAAEALFYDGDTDRPVVGYAQMHDRADRIERGEL